MSNQASLGDISEPENEEENLEEDTESYESRQIKNLVEIQNGYAFKKKDYAENSDVFLFRATNFTEDGAIDLSEEAYLPEDYYDEFEDYQLEKNDIIINMVGANTGKMCLIDSKVLPALLNQNMWKLKPKEGINQHFFYYRLKKGVSEILRTKQGSTRGFLTKYTFKNLSLDSIPSDIDEQRRIASVLYNVDQAISKTEEIIEQTQRVKKGLMQDLFTEGYYSHEEFEDSRFAKYPEEWDSNQVRDLIDEEVIEKIMDGNHGEQHPTSEDFIEEGIPFVTSDAVWNSHIDWEDAKKISEETYENLRKGFAEPGDVLLTHKGSVGRVGRVPEDKEKVMLSPQVTYYRINDEEILDPEYLKYFFRSSFCQKEMAGHSQQSTRDYIGLTKQKTLKIHIPEIEEQRKIADALNSMDQKIEREKEEKEQLQRLKKGLMQDLLTGGVRTGEDVRVLDEVVEVEG